MRLIDADALKDKFRGTNANGINLELDRYAIKCIDDAPTIVQERKKGRWIAHYLGKWKDVPWGYDCSECGAWFVIGQEYITKYNYCPHCGAHMEGEEDARRNERCHADL